MIGKTISHYKILEKLGDGGMGVVYKTEDTKLKCLVAIKFLPRQIAASDDERERFKIEAQAAAALNHPNIGTIHAIEEIEDEMFIVMEFIDGQELRKLLIDNGQLSIANCLNYATQIAEGLRAAHSQGISHRDIKSSNIMITREGRAKIMDFGLAKVRGGSGLTQVQRSYEEVFRWRKGTYVPRKPIMNAAHSKPGKLIMLNHSASDPKSLNRPERLRDEAEKLRAQIESQLDPSLYPSAWESGQRQRLAEVVAQILN